MGHVGSKTRTWGQIKGNTCELGMSSIRNFVSIYRQANIDDTAIYRYTCVNKCLGRQLNRNLTLFALNK